LEQTPWWVAAIVTPTLLGALGGLGWLVRFALNSITGSQKSFIDYLKQQTDNDREERDGWRQSLAEHTEVSKQMYTNLKEIGDYLKKRNGT